MEVVAPEFRRPAPQQARDNPLAVSKIPKAQLVLHHGLERRRAQPHISLPVRAAKTERAKKVAAAATGQVAALLPADPPQSLKTLAFNGPDGKAMTLADRTGRTVLVNLWATWCAPCRAEMPALDALQKEKGSDKFEVMAINVDTGDDTKPKAFLDEIGVKSLAHYRDASMGVFNDLKKRGLALGLPVTLLVDGEGCLIGHMNGPAEWSGADAMRLMDAALAN